MSDLTRETEQRDWYASNYAKAGADRNDLRLNRGVLFQILATERSVIQAFRRIVQPPHELRVLDVGCGSGASWYQLIRLGVKPAHMVGIEIQSSRLAELKETYPQAAALSTDATAMEFPNGSFGLVYESTMFATLTDEQVRRSIASEMVRVCKPGGYLLLVDWHVRKFWDPRFGALTRADLRRLFGLGSSTKLICMERGALIPPLGRWLSKHASPLYFIIAWLFPPLVGQVAYLLQKQAVNIEANG